MKPWLKAIGLVMGMVLAWSLIAFCVTLIYISVGWKIGLPFVGFVVFCVLVYYARGFFDE